VEGKEYIAVDLGAESGRVMLGAVAGDKLSLREIHRFANTLIEECGSLRWNFEALLAEVKAGISKAAKAAKGRVSGIGFDSWGVDFGLIDGEGELIENPYHYRDRRTNGVREKAFELMSKRAIYENYGEYTLASTSQLMDMRSGQWSKEIFDGLSLPMGIMPDIVDAGTTVGQLKSEVAKELGCEQIPVIAVASHDTGSAVAAVPAADANWAYISSGTWSLIGVEVPEAIIDDKSFEHSFTNEGGVENTIRLLKNIMGLWLVQECRRQWQREGPEFSYPELTEMAAKARPFTAHIDPDYSEFLAPGDMPARINDYLAARDRDRIDDKGQMIRVILESLGFKYRWALEKIEEITGGQIDCLHIVGGGIQNGLLCQFAANATGKRVVTGPIEATASGNILMQAKAAGQIESLAEARGIVRNSFALKEYQPQDTSLWNERYKQIVWE
jgi:sugar (pentulose or hexulose) kinase